MCRSRPRILFAASCLLMLALTGLTLPRSDSPTPPIDWNSGQPYALSVEDGTAACDLAFGRGTRYVFIISSLADAGEMPAVELEATSIERIGICPATRVPPLRRRLARNPDATCRTRFWPRVESSIPAATVPRCSEVADSEEPHDLRNRVLRDFDLYVTDGPLGDPRQYAHVEARLIGEGDSVRVFLDGQQTVAELAPGLVDEIVALMDRTVIPETARRFGPAADVDGDGRFAVLLTPWLQRLQGGRTALGGFVRSGDFRDDLDPPFGNHSDVLYLNSNVRPGAHLRNLLAHEYVHAVCFSQNLPDEEDWLNEALAHQAEPGWTNLHHRISAYLAAPHRYPLVVSDYFRAGLWRNHGCRGATFLFLRWCTDQFGEELLRELIHNPVRGTRNLETVTGVAFEDLYRHWSLAVLQSTLTTAGGSGREPSLCVAEDRQRQILADDAPSSAFTSLDLAGRIDNWGLAGPRRLLWKLAPNENGRRTIALRGTSTAYLEVAASEHGPRRIRIVAPPDSKLQVSVLKLPEDFPAVQGSAAWLAMNPSEEAAANRTHVRVDVAFSPGSPETMDVSLMAFEQDGELSRRSVCLSGRELEEHLVAPASGSRRYVVGLPAARFRCDRPVTVKVVAADARGRRATDVWTLPPRTADRLRQAVAVTQRPDSPSCGN